MALRELLFRSPPSLALAEGATTPNPGFNGVTVWSTTLSRYMIWNGTLWASVPLLTGDNVFLGQNRPAYVVASAISTTSTFTFNPATHGQVVSVSLTNAITVTFGAPTGIVAGCMYKFVMVAADTASRLFAWNTAFKFPTATSPVASGSTFKGGTDIVTFLGGASNTLIYDGSNLDVR